MTKRGFIRTLSFITAAFVCLAAYGIMSASTASSYKARLEVNYQQSLNELSESLDTIETNLKKSVYANSDTTLYQISRDLYSQTNSAKDALSRLPVNQMNLGGTYKFLSQASDYASYLASKLSSGESISSQEHENLSKLLEYAGKYEQSVADMVAVCNMGGTITDRNVKSSAGANVAAISTDFDTAEESFKNYPTLLYDGPFADAVLSRDAQMLKNAEEITQETARSTAAAAIECNIKELRQQGDEAGKIPCYVYSYNKYTIGITKQGGYVAYILFGGKINDKTISEDNAQNIAASFLNSLGYKNMQKSYYAVSNNVITVNFAYCENAVTCYADLVKVGVSLSDGKVVSLEAKGYIANHTSRKKWSGKIKQEKAQQAISSYLKIIDTKKCIIPKENGKEVMCYEFHVESSSTGEEALIYVNADTGKEEDIMLLLYSDNGTLTK